MSGGWVQKAGVVLGNDHAPARRVIGLQQSIFGASVAMSWLWGLGFFFSIHFAQAYGWVGLIAFAVPNALGLFLFGVGVNRLARNHDLRAWIESRVSRRPWLFLSYQLIAVSLTLFAVVKYLFIELGFDTGLVWGMALLCIALLTAEMLGFQGVLRLHGAALLVFCAAGLALFFFAPHAEALPARGSYDFSFLGLAIPLAVGLLLGPWLDLQQWQRAIAMAEAGESPAKGFALGALLFFGLLLILGGLSLALVHDDATPLLSAWDGRSYAHGLLTNVLESGETPWALLLFALMAVLAVISTLDSAHLALKWCLRNIDRSSESPLLALLPASLRTSTLPTFALALAIAAGALALGADLAHFMVLYATIFLAGSTSLVLAALRPQASAPKASLVLLTGAASLALMMIGYLEQREAIMLLGLAMPLLLLVPHRNEETTEAPPKVKREASSGRVPAPASQAEPVAQESPPPQAHSTSSEANTGWFDEHWFTVPLVPTYNDTNSVGNVYFANYVGWVGKARELLFRYCMPDFSLENTNFFILTRSFNHKFLREIREFQAVRVRLRISSYNRKFVKLEHEIREMDGTLVGKGDQSLMFVESENYGLIDIPGSVYSAFIKYAPPPEKSTS